VLAVERDEGDRVRHRRPTLVFGLQCASASCSTSSAAPAAWASSPGTSSC
jgi:hypothetical protein